MTPDEPPSPHTPPTVPCTFTCGQCGFQASARSAAALDGHIAAHVIYHQAPPVEAVA